MKVFFAASPRGREKYGVYYKKIYREIENLGFKHLDDDVLRLTYPEMVDKAHVSEKSYNEYALRKLHHSQEADICIFEVSVPSLGIGFTIERALQVGKPVIVLYYKDNVPYVLAGIDDDKLILRSYDDKSLKRVVKETIQQARERRDRRFNFFINPKLLDFIEEASRKQGITKSKFIRNLILEHMHKSA